MLASYYLHIAPPAPNMQSQLLPHLLVQDQYKLCYENMQSYLDSFDTYANFKLVNDEKVH